jgi:hypothetical protein
VLLAKRVTRSTPTKAAPSARVTRSTPPSAKKKGQKGKTGEVSVAN